MTEREKVARGEERKRERVEWRAMARTGDDFFNRGQVASLRRGAQAIYT